MLWGERFDSVIRDHSILYARPAERRLAMKHVSYLRYRPEHATYRKTVYGDPIVPDEEDLKDFDPYVLVRVKTDQQGIRMYDVYTLLRPES